MSYLYIKVLFLEKQIFESQRLTFPTKRNFIVLYFMIFQLVCCHIMVEGKNMKILDIHRQDVVGPIMSSLSLSGVLKSVLDNERWGSVVLGQRLHPCGTTVLHTAIII